MTINVAIKCPEGIVLGADSLISLMAEDQTARAVMPYHRKLFQLGQLPVGVLLNGQIAVNGQTLEDMVAEFSATAGFTTPVQVLDVASVVRGLGEFLQARIGDTPSAFQLIVGGYSRGKPGVRYGEIYVLTWPEGSIESLYGNDKSFGHVFAGRPDPIYRFLYGFDRFTAKDVARQWKGLFEQTRDYVIAQIEATGQKVSSEVKALPVPSFREINPWTMVSSFDPASMPPVSLEETLTRVMESSRLPYTPVYGFFSLPMAVNFAWHMLMLPYVESNFLAQWPTVGSQLRIATITRDNGFQQLRPIDPGVMFR